MGNLYPSAIRKLRAKLNISQTELAILEFLLPLLIDGKRTPSTTVIAKEKLKQLFKDNHIIMEED